LAQTVAEFVQAIKTAYPKNSMVSARRYMRSNPDCILWHHLARRAPEELQVLRDWCIETKQAEVFYKQFRERQKTMLVTRDSRIVCPAWMVDMAIEDAISALDVTYGRDRILLKECIKTRKFEEDLFWRLSDNIILIQCAIAAGLVVPSLREIQLEQASCEP